MERERLAFHTLRKRHQDIHARSLLNYSSTYECEQEARQTRVKEDEIKLSGIHYTQRHPIYILIYIYYYVYIHTHVY